MAWPPAPQGSPPWDGPHRSPLLDARKGVGSALGAGSQGTLGWTSPSLTLPTHCPQGALWPRRTPGSRSLSPPGRQEGQQQAHHPQPSPPPSSLPSAEPVGSAPRGHLPRRLASQEAFCHGAGSNSGLKGHMSPRFSWWEAPARAWVTAGGLGSLWKQEPQVLSCGGRVHGGGVFMTSVGS